VAEPGDGDAHPARPPVGHRGGKARRGARPPQGRAHPHRLGQPDTLLRAPPLHARQRPPHRPRRHQPGLRARRQHRRVHRSVSEVEAQRRCVILDFGFWILDFGFAKPKSRINKLLLVIVILAFLLPVSAGGPARGQAAQGGLVVDAQSADARFPDTVDFELKAHGFEASRAELSYRLTGEPVTSELHATVDKPASNLDLTATLDLSTDYIPPGSEVTYYWTLTSDTAGEAYTPEQTFVMLDDRHAW